MTALILLSEFQKTEIELWLPIAEAPDYDVSSLGRIRSFRTRTRAGFPSKRGLTSRLIKHFPDKVGYRILELQTPGGPKSLSVHVLVAKAFLPKPEGDDQVNHKNAIKGDCRLRNLEWSNHFKNHEHATVNGLRRRGENHHAAKLTDAQALSIQQRIAAGTRQCVLVREFNVSKHTISRIARGIRLAAR